MGLQWRCIYPAENCNLGSATMWAACKSPLTSSTPTASKGRRSLQRGNEAGGGVLKTKSPLAFHSQVLARKDKSLSPSCWALAPSSVQFSSVQLLSRVRLFATPWTQRLPCPSPIPRVYSNSCPLSRWCHPTISSSVSPFCPQHQDLSQWDSFSHQVTKVLELQLQHQFFQSIFRTDFL